MSVPPTPVLVAIVRFIKLQTFRSNALLGSAAGVPLTSEKVEWHRT
jgi:hypothetical protein